MRSESSPNWNSLFDRPRSRWFAYGAAFAMAIVALALRRLLHPVLGERALYSTFFPAVLIAAYAGGFRPGMIVTCVCVSVGNFFLADPPFVLGYKGGGDVVAMVIFVLTGAFISGLSESLHRAQRRIVIAERRRAEELLRVTEERFRQLVENINDVFWIIDSQLEHFFYISPAFEEVCGRPRQLLYDDPKSWAELVHPLDRDEVMSNIQRRVEGIFKDLEYRIVRPDGSTRWVRSRSFPIASADQPMARIAGLIEDITDRKQAEEALRDSELRFRGTFENAAVGIAHLDLDGKFLRVNEKLCNITGFSRDELLTRRFQEITHPDDLTPDLEQLEPLLRGETSSSSRDKRYVRKDGAIVWVAVSTSLQRDADGRSVNFISVARDVTHRRRLEEELRHAKDVAEGANRAKDEFLANVSHEIRTPMNAILGMTELALDTPLTEDQRGYLKTVKSAADNLLGILNDLLDFSKIEAGKLELDPAPFLLRTAIGDMLQALAVQAHRKGLELVCTIDPDVPDFLVGDVGRLRQVLLNLVVNAVKFTAAGEVIVRVETTEVPCPDGEVVVLFSVADTGIGIPFDKQESIFYAFQQEDSSTTRKYGGTGLGLTIASRLVDLMGGKITLLSSPGEGSTFAFTAKFRLDERPVEPHETVPPLMLHDLPVLVVDDNAANRQILEEWLRRWNMAPVVVGDGVTAMDALWSSASHQRQFPLVLLDARMPDIDGLSLAAKIRERTELATTRIVLLSSGDRPSDAARSHQLGIDARLLKPVRQDELLQTIYRVMSRPGSSSLPVAEVPPRQSSKTGEGESGALRILVAEDNEFNVQLLEQLLTRRGHRVGVARNGKDALSLSETEDFDLLLLDVHMPELDGFQVIDAIRERERIQGGHLPVIALTARSRQEDREKCLAAGMDAFLAKPIQAGELQTAIAHLIQAQAGATPNSLEETLSVDAAELLDKRALLAACGGDNQILSRICESFRESVPEHLTALRRSLDSGDARALREAAHKLHGMIAVFSSVAGELASHIEDRADEADLAACVPLIERLEAAGGALVRQSAGLTVESLT